VLEAFAELLVMPDTGPVKIALASVVANYAPGDVVWPLLVGAARVRQVGDRARAP